MVKRFALATVCLPWALPAFAAANGPVTPAQAPFAIQRTGDTMTGPWFATTTTAPAATTNIHTTTPANGFFAHPAGSWLDYCSVSGCLPGPHLLAQDVLFETTHTDASAQETGLAINMTSATGKAAYWAPSTSYAVGYQVHAGSGQDIYQVTTAGTSASSGSGPNFCPNPNPTTAPNPQCSNPATNSAGNSVSGGETNASTGTDGSVTWTFVGAGINDGKTGLAIGVQCLQGAGHCWGQATAMSQASTDLAGKGIPWFLYEMDPGNNTGYNYDIGGPIAGVIYINGSNPNRMTCAVCVFTAAPAATKAYNSLILFNGDQLVNGDSIDDATSGLTVLHTLSGHTHGTAVWYDQSTAPTGALLNGSYSNAAIDTSAAAFSGTANALRMSTNSYLAWAGGSLNGGITLSTAVNAFAFQIGGTNLATLSTAGLAVLPTTASTAYNNGALTVAGGLGVNGAINANGQVLGTYHTATGTNGSFTATDRTASNSGSAAFYRNNGVNYLYDSGGNNVISYTNTSIGLNEPTSISGALTNAAGLFGMFTTTNGAWQTYTPTITCNSGSLTTYTAYGRYQASSNKIMHLKVSLQITTAGSCTAPIVASLPVAAVNAGGTTDLSGREDVVTGDFLQGQVAANSSTILFLAGQSNGTTSPNYTPANNWVMNVGGFYESQ